MRFRAREVEADEGRAQGGEGALSRVKAHKQTGNGRADQNGRGVPVGDAPAQV